jgi:hypothetical protein
VGEEGVRLNYGHPLVNHLSGDRREELVTDVAEFMDCMACVEQEWMDSSDPETKRWQSPLEFLVNNWAWGWMERHPEWMEATVDAVLVSAGLAPQGLECLDQADQYSLVSSLAAAATQALRSGWDVREGLRERLVEWLQDWTDTDEENLATLLGLAQSMSPTRHQEEVTTWDQEGF